MAKESKSERSKAGKKAWKKKVADARAAGKKHVRVGKNLVAIGPKTAPKKAPKKAAKAQASKRPEAARAPSARKPKSGSRKGKRETKRAKAHSPRRRHYAKTRTVQVRVPAKIRRLKVQASERRHHHKRRRHGHRRHYSRERFAMDNPLSTMEVIGGGLAMLFGLAVADVSDRYWATHALTATSSTSGTTTTTTYTDTPAVTSSSGMATFGTGLYPGMLNGASVIAPMNTTRWVSGAAISLLPFAGAAFIKDATWRTGLQMFGFGALARIGGKALVDLFASLLGSTSIGQQLYVNELAATAQYQVAMGQTPTIQLPSPGTNPPAAGGPGSSASGLARPQTQRAAGVGKAPQGDCGCSACSKGLPCGTLSTTTQTSQQAAPPVSSTTTTVVPTAPQPAPTVPVGTPALPAPTPAQSVSSLLTGNVSLPSVTQVPGVAAQTSTSGDTSLGRPNPYAWSEHLTERLTH